MTFTASTRFDTVLHITITEGESMVKELFFRVGNLAAMIIAAPLFIVGVWMIRLSSWIKPQWFGLNVIDETECDDALRW